MTRFFIDKRILPERLQRWFIKVAAMPGSRKRFQHHDSSWADLNIFGLRMAQIKKLDRERPCRT
jgi:hypothetical protein